MDNYDFKNLSVLICDDSRPMRKLIAMFLHGFGIKAVVDVPGPFEGFQEFVTGNIDLIITDWNMSPVDGLEFVEDIRNNPVSPNPYIPVIMLTGFTELYRVQMARDIGITSFLAKPVSADSLYKRLVSIVNDHRTYIRVDDFFGPDRRFHVKEEFAGTNRRSFELI